MIFQCVFFCFVFFGMLGKCKLFDFSCGSSWVISSTDEMSFGLCYILTLGYTPLSYKVFIFRGRSNYCKGISGQIEMIIKWLPEAARFWGENQQKLTPWMEWSTGLGFESSPPTSSWCPMSDHCKCWHSRYWKNHLALILINTNNQLLKQAKNRQLYIYVKHEGIFYKKAIVAPVTYPNLVLGETAMMNPGKSRVNYSWTIFRLWWCFSTVWIFTFSGFLKMIWGMMKGVTKCKTCFHRWIVHF